MTDNTDLHFNEARLISQLSSFVPQIHLTLVSVLQGIALVFLMTSVHGPASLTFAGITAALFTYHGYLPQIVSFVLIIIVWDQFASATFFLHWPLTSVSTIFQFLLTICEVAAFTHTDSIGYWVSWVGAIGVIGAIIHARNLRIVSPTLYTIREIVLDRADTNRNYWMLGILIPLGLLREVAASNFAVLHHFGTLPFTIFDFAVPAVMLVIGIVFLVSDDNSWVQRCNDVLVHADSRYHIARNGMIVDRRSVEQEQS